MRSKQLPERYAKSLISLSLERDELEKVYADIRYLKEICKTSTEFTNMLKSPLISTPRKISIINAVVNDHIGELTQCFINLVIRKRVQFLPDILSVFIEKYNQLKGIQEVKLTTAIQIDDALKSVFIQKLKKRENLEKVELTSFVDPEIIGGFILEYDNYVWDASIRRLLDDLDKILTNR